MYSRNVNNLFFTHDEWKRNFDNWRVYYGDQDDAKNIDLLNSVITHQLADERHFDYHFNTYHLLVSFIKSLQNAFKEYDLSHIQQPVAARFFMAKMNTIMSNIQFDLKLITDMKAIDLKKLQNEYDLISLEMLAYIDLIAQNSSALHNMMRGLLQQYAINTNQYIRKPMTDNDVAWLNKYELAAYNEALTNLTKITNGLPTIYQDIKTECNKLCHKIESNRIKDEESCSIIRQNSFDYKRQTINLNSTIELLKNPTDLSEQNSYQKLISNNAPSFEKQIILSMKLIFGSILQIIPIIAFLSLAVTVPPIAIGFTFLVFGACAGAGIGIGANVIKQKLTNTEARMSGLFKAIKQEPAKTLTTSSTNITLTAT